MSQVSVEHISRCVNLECPNTPEGGVFSIVRFSDEKIVGGFRSITIVMCGPCAAAIRELNKS